MNKYKHLMSNTLIFAIATFGSKLLPFLLLPFYTSVLPPDAYGVQEIITSTCNLILPIMYLSMGEAVIRFGLDSSIRKRDVFTTGVLTVLIGFVIFLCFMPLVRQIPTLRDYVWLIYIYIIASAMHTVTAQFVRASGFVRFFALDGIFTTLTTVLMNILLLVKFKMGASGYVLSIVIADALSTILLFLVLKLYRFIKIRSINMNTVKAMLKYSVPLVPTAIFWWITSLSDRYFIKYFCGDAAVGLYTVSQKLPNLIMLVSMIFTQAWQLSAFTEYKSPEGERFFSTVFKSYYTFIFLASSGLILVCRPVLDLLDARYNEAWRFTPILVVAVAFSTLVTFLGTIYNAVHKNGMVMLTTFIGAGVNIGLNFVLIPKFGPMGAAISTFSSYFVVFVIRAIDSRRYIKIKMQPLRIAFTLALLFGQIVIALKAPPFWPLWEILIILVLVGSNFGYIWFLMKRLLNMMKKRAA